MPGSAQVLIASNRGPVAFSLADNGRLTMKRGGGGLVSAMAHVATEDAAVWVCAALSDADRRAARGAPNGRIDKAGHDTNGAAVRMLPIEPTTFHRAYNSIANSTLWFINHLLYDTPTKPVFDARFRREWAAYQEYNEAFADALAEEAAPNARVMIQDYHLVLAPRMLRERRPDVSIAHFMHTPWAPPAYFRLLPDDLAIEVLNGILGADHAGFHSSRWAEAFVYCCADLLGTRTRNGAVAHDAGTTRIGVHPLGVDADSLRARAHESDVDARRTALLDVARGRRILLRIDRTELSKNIVRGLAAYRELLRVHPEWRGEVVHFVYAYPSRHDLPEYREYTAQVQRIAREIEDEFATPDWSPIELAVTDDFPRSLAAYRIADVLVVNPIRDGMNLVAKEGPVLSERGCALVLSREAGASEELGADAFLVNPYDVSETAEAMHHALSLSDADRGERTQRLAAKSTEFPPQDWFAQQLAALG